MLIQNETTPATEVLVVLKAMALLKGSYIDNGAVKKLERFVQYRTMGGELFFCPIEPGKKTPLYPLRVNVDPILDVAEKVVDHKVSLILDQSVDNLPHFDCPTDFADASANDNTGFGTVLGGYRLVIIDDEVSVDQVF